MRIKIFSDMRGENFTAIVQVRSKDARGTMQNPLQKISMIFFDLSKIYFRQAKPTAGWLWVSLERKEREKIGEWFCCVYIIADHGKTVVNEEKRVCE